MAEKELRTDQSSREASGARPYGRYLEDFEVGAVYEHWPAKTVTEADDHLFCLVTMNHHPLHLNDVYAGESQQGQNVVVGPLVYSLALGMSVADVSPLRRNLRSNSSSDGGEMKNISASGRLARTWRAPCISISRRMSRPSARAASTPAFGVP